MSDTEQMAEDLKNARTLVKTLHAEHYAEVVTPYMKQIRERMQKTGESTLLATFEITKTLVGYIPRLECLAAGIEIIAPSGVSA